jgi:hypothetical protein
VKDYLKPGPDALAAWTAEHGHEDPSLVWLTTSPAVAKGYAAYWSMRPWCAGSGSVYRVDPAERPVPVYHSGREEWTCPQAAVAEVIARGVTHASSGAFSAMDTWYLLDEECYWFRIAAVRPPPAARRVLVRA